MQTVHVWMQYHVPKFVCGGEPAFLLTQSNCYSNNSITLVNGPGHARICTSIPRIAQILFGFNFESFQIQSNCRINKVKWVHGDIPIEQF